MTFFDSQEALLVGNNGFFGIQKGELRIKPADVFVMSCVDEFYAALRKNIFLAKKAVKKIFTYFSMMGERAVTLQLSFRSLFHRACALVSLVCGHNES